MVNLLTHLLLSSIAVDKGTCLLLLFPKINNGCVDTEELIVVSAPTLRTVDILSIWTLSVVWYCHSEVFGVCLWGSPITRCRLPVLSQSVLSVRFFNQLWGGGFYWMLSLNKQTACRCYFQGVWKLSGGNWRWLYKPADHNPNRLRCILLKLPGLDSAEVQEQHKATICEHF